MKATLIHLLKLQLAYARWGILSWQDLELIRKSSWSMVWRANYLRSSPGSTADTITLDRMTDESST